MLKMSSKIQCFRKSVGNIDGGQLCVKFVFSSNLSLPVCNLQTFVCSGVHKIINEHGSKFCGDLGGFRK